MADPTCVIIFEKYSPIERTVMSLSKKISLTFFLSIIMFVLCISATAVKEQHIFGSDKYGWPHIFFMITYDEGKIKAQDFDINKFLIDYSVWLGLTASIMFIIRLMKVNRKSA